MNRQSGSMDGILEAWFLDGPNEMPDRLFEAVLDQVERAPQRRLARLRLRFADMSPTVRLLVAAGATIFVLGVGVATVGALRPTPSSDPITTPPSPSALAAPSSSPLVEGALRHPFLGQLRSELPAPGGQDRSVIEITDDSFAYNDGLMRSRASSPAAGTLVLTTEFPSGGCAAGDQGEYTWSESGQARVSFTLVADACQARAAVVGGEWLRSDCANPDNFCLGPLEPGQYVSFYVDPFVPSPFVDPNARWHPRYGAITYTAPAGWENTDDWPDHYGLKLVDGADGTAIWVFSDVVPIDPNDPCRFVPDASAGRTAADLAASVSGLPGVTASAVEDVIVGGLTGKRIDIAMDPEWTATCPFSEGLPTVPLYGDTNPSEDGFAWTVGPGWAMRHWFLDLGDGRALVIFAEAPDQSTFDGFIDEATEIVESTVFNR